MTPEPHHPQKVSDAIQLALHNIDLLRDLVNAPDDATGKNLLAILKKYDPKLDLRIEELLEFRTSLRTGKMEMDAGKLVAFYFDLASKKPPTRGRPPENEWKP